MSTTTSGSREYMAGRNINNQTKHWTEMPSAFYDKKEEEHMAIRDRP